MAAVMVRAQQAPDDPTRAVRRDNLYEPREDGEIEGTQDEYVRRRSYFLEMQKHPGVTAAALGVAVAALALLPPLATSLSGGRRTANEPEQRPKERRNGSKIK